jgi:hypothetical protein
MKAVIIFALCLFIAGCKTEKAVLPPPPDTNWYTSRAAADSFEISTAAELAGLAALVNRKDSAVNFSGKTIALAGDIDLSAGYGKGYNSGKGWIPIGKDSVNSFRGAFDGNRKAIRGLYINDSALDNAGLFGVIGGDSAEVARLGVAGADIRGGDNAGGVAGWIYRDGGVASGMITHCYATGAVSGKNRVGGIAGFVGGRGAIGNSYAAAAVSGYCCVGGVAGHVDAAANVRAVANCYSVGAVGGEFSCVGGVVGELRGGAVSFCAALNPSVKLANKELQNAGRVVGKLGGDSVAVLSGNIASSRMAGRGGDAVWLNRGPRAKDGADIAAGAGVGSALGHIFDNALGWTAEDGKLPGFGGGVDMPEHLSYIGATY